MGVYSVIKTTAMALSFLLPVCEPADEAQIQQLVDLAEKMAPTDSDAAMGHIRSAIELEKRRSADGKTPNVVWLRLRLAELLGKTHQIDQEKAELEEIQKLGGEIFDKDSTQTDWAFVLETLATRVEEDLGDYERALKLMRQSSETYRIASGEDSSDYGNSLSNLARIEERMGLHADARIHATKAVKILSAQPPKAPLRLASAQNNLAQVLMREGAFDEAVTLLIDAKTRLLPEVDENRPDKFLRYYAGLVHQLGAAYDGLHKQLRETGDPRTDDVKAMLEAEFKTELSLRLEKLKLPPDDYEVLSTKNSYAAFLIENGRAEEAEPIFRDLANQTAGVAGLRELHVISLLHLAISQEQQEHLSDAKQTIRETLTEAEEQILPGAFLRTVVLKCAARILGGNEGDELWNRSLDALHQWVDATASSQPTANQHRMAQQYLPIVHEYAFQAVAVPAKLGSAVRPNPENIYRHLLAWKGGVFLRQRALQTALRSNDPDIAAIARQLESTTGELSELLGNADEITESIEQSREHVNNLETKLSLRISIPRMSVDRQMLEHLKDSLPAKSVLVDFYEIQIPDSGATPEFQLLAFIVSKDTPIEIVNLGRSSAVNEAVSEWRDALMDLAHLDRLKVATRKVQELLWTPIEKVGNLRDQRTLFYSPDGPVCGFPLSALPAWNPGREYLIEEDLLIACLPAPRIILTNKAVPADKTAMSLLIANPLATTGADTRNIENLFKPGNYRVLPGTEATCGAFRQYCGQYSFVYLHGHGTSAQDNKFLTNSTLSITDTDPDAAIQFYEGEHLTAAEMAFLPLSGTRLVCLVACQSALGKPLRGEPLLGMCRATHIAGADAVLASLWDVDQAAANSIAESMITRSVRNLDEPTLALRNAQREFCLKARSAGEIEAHPFFWAAWSISVSRPK